MTFTSPEHGFTIGFSDSFVFLMNRSSLILSRLYWTTLLTSLGQWCQVLFSAFVVSLLPFVCFFQLLISTSTSNTKVYPIQMSNCLSLHVSMWCWSGTSWRFVWTVLSHSLWCLCCQFSIFCSEISLWSFSHFEKWYVDIYNLDTFIWASHFRLLVNEEKQELLSYR